MATSKCRQPTGNLQWRRCPACVLCMALPHSVLQQSFWVGQVRGAGRTKSEEDATPAIAVTLLRLHILTFLDLSHICASLRTQLTLKGWFVSWRVSVGVVPAMASAPELCTFLTLPGTLPFDDGMFEGGALLDYGSRQLGYSILAAVAAATAATCCHKWMRTTTLPCCLQARA